MVNPVEPTAEAADASVADDLSAVFLSAVEDEAEETVEDEASAEPDTETEAEDEVAEEEDEDVEESDDDEDDGEEDGEESDEEKSDEDKAKDEQKLTPSAKRRLREKQKLDEARAETEQIKSQVKKVETDRAEALQYAQEAIAAQAEVQAENEYLRQVVTAFESQGQALPTHVVENLRLRHQLEQTKRGAEVTKKAQATASKSQVETFRQGIATAVMKASRELGVKSTHFAADLREAIENGTVEPSVEGVQALAKSVADANRVKAKVASHQPPAKAPPVTKPKGKRGPKIDTSTMDTFLDEIMADPDI